MSHNESVVQVGVISCVELLCAWKQKSYSTQYLSSKHIQTGFEKSKVPIQLLDQANKVQNILEIHRMTAGAARFLFCIAADNKSTTCCTQMTRKLSGSTSHTWIALLLALVLYMDCVSRTLPRTFRLPLQSVLRYTRRRAFVQCAFKLPQWLSRFPEVLSQWAGSRARLRGSTGGGRGEEVRARALSPCLRRHEHGARDEERRWNKKKRKHL